MSTTRPASRLARGSRFSVLAVCWFIALAVSLWAVGALCYDFPWPALRTTVSIIYGIVLVGALFRWRGSRFNVAIPFIGFAIILGWWLTLKPSSDRAWQPDVAQLAWAEIQGDVVTLHQVRNVDYRTETDFTPRWETRTVRLSQMTGVDIAVNYWGSPYMAHPIASFQFADSPPVCFSIETRKEVGESYSAIGGLFRQFELIYVVADERDVIRVRTNFRKGEDVYLYRTNATPEQARERFMEYLSAVNSLREQPRWYNALTTNCTTAIRTQHAVEKRAPWDWRMLVNGKGDEMMFERRTIRTGGLGFSELKSRSLINPAARATSEPSDFSARIRASLPGF